MGSAPEPRFSADEITGLLTSVGGSQARRLTPTAVGQLLRREANRGVSSKRLAEELQMPPGTSVITWFLRLPDLPGDIQDLVQFGRPAAGLSLTQAAEIARLHPNENAMRVLAKAAIEHRLTGAEVRSAVQLIKRRQIDQETAVSEVLRGRPTVERRHVQIGTLSEAVQNVIAPLNSNQRKEALRSALTSLGVGTLEAILSDTRYTLVLDETQAARLNQEGLDPDSLEAAINAALRDSHD